MSETTDDRASDGSDGEDRTDNPDSTDSRGVVTTSDAGGDSPGGPCTHARAVDPLTVAKRLQQDGRWWGRVEQEKNDMIKLARAQGMTRPEAQSWAYGEIDRLYPPLAEPEPAKSKCQDATLISTDAGRVQGLGSIPADWPDLPATASLQADLQWVQSNRLSIVEGTGSGAIRVHLDRAHEPAPSRAALGWLETSIRSYAKYVDVVARSLKDEEDEQDMVRRERMRIEEIKALLREMREG